LRAVSKDIRINRFAPGASFDTILRMSLHMIAIAPHLTDHQVDGNLLLAEHSQLGGFYPWPIVVKFRKG